MPLNDLIIEEIRKKEERERREQERPQPQLPIPEPHRRPPPREPSEQNPDDGNRRGVEIIEPGEDTSNVPYGGLQMVAYKGDES
jgi:hypothetical protein